MQRSNFVLQNLMKKKVLKQLKAISEKLPPQIQKQTIKLTGKQVKERYPDRQGIDEKKLYTVTVNVPSSSYKTLKRLQREYGIDGVNKFIIAQNERAQIIIDNYNAITKLNKDEQTTTS